MHEDEVEISPFKSRVKIQRCAACGEPLASELVARALRERGGPTVTALMAGEDLCPRCRREKLARELTMAVPDREVG
jgi:ribosomal protein L34E